MKKVTHSVPPNTISVADTRSDKIYASKMALSPYKLHRVQAQGKERWAWIHLPSSNCYGNGTYDSMHEALLRVLTAGEEVFEFDSVKEFAVWLTNNS